MSRAALAVLGALAVVGALAVRAAGDGDAAADQAFRAGLGSVDALERLGEARPVTRWTDEAWLEAARLAERAGELGRARRDLERAIALTIDPQLRRRAEALKARLDAITGEGRWAEVAARHEQLVARIETGGDPRAALDELAELVRTHPGYPRANAGRLAIAKGWEREGQVARAIAWLRDAVAAEANAPGAPAHVELARALIRAGRLDEAATEVRALEGRPLVDQIAVDEIARRLADAQLRAWLRVALWGVMGLLTIVGAAVLRRDAGSWRAAGRQLARPPQEVWYLGPLALVIVGVAATGNPLVARAVRAIVISGVAIAWLSGALLEAARKPVRAPRAIVQAVLAVVAVAAASYLVVDHDRMIDLVIETWRSGPAPR